MDILTRVRMRSFALLSEPGQWFRRRFTPAGGLVMAGLVFSAILGVNTRATAIYQMFSLLFALVALAGVSCLVFRGRFTVKRVLPRFATAGERFTYHLHVTNHGARDQVGLEVLDRLDRRLPTAGEFLALREPGEERRNLFDRLVGYHRWEWLLSRKQGARIGVHSTPPVVPSGGKVAIEIPVVPLRRGPVRFTEVQVGRTDPCGLLRSLLTVPAPQSMLVLPKHYPMAPLDLPGSRRYQRGGVALANSVGESEEFISLREYRPGDPRRHIHWKSWAKCHTPIVKEYVDEFFVRRALVLDTFAGPEKEDLLEAAVSVAASVALNVEAQDSLLELMFVGTEVYSVTVGRGLGGADQILEMLATVGPCSGRDFSSLTGSVVEKASSLCAVVCVLLAWDERRRELVRYLRSKGLAVKALLVARPGDERTAAPHYLTVIETNRIAEGLAAL